MNGKVKIGKLTYKSVKKELKWLQTCGQDAIAVIYHPSVPWGVMVVTDPESFDNKQLPEEVKEEKISKVVYVYINSYAIASLLLHANESADTSKIFFEIIKRMADKIQ